MSEEGNKQFNNMGNFVVQIALQTTTTLLYEAEEAVFRLIEEAVSVGKNPKDLFRENTGHDITEEIQLLKDELNKLPNKEILKEPKKKFMKQLKGIEEMIEEYS
jgi:hypothetical protein